MAGARDRRGRFRPGCSGNPAGKSAGVVSRSTELKNALLAAVGPEDVARLARCMLDAGCSGDVKAARLILEYVVPKPIRVDLATTPAPGVKILPRELLEAV